MMTERSLPLHIAKAGIDYFFSTYPSRHIRFYGPGEPTEEFCLMKEIVAYAKEKTNEPLLVEIQSNGCFSQAIREWFLENINIAWISFDGEPDIQNANRPFAEGLPSAPIIEDNVRWLNTNSGNRNIMIGARVTITEKNVNRQKQIVDYFLSLGIRYIWTDPLFPSVDRIPVYEDESKRKAFSFDMDAYVDNYIYAYHYAKNNGIFYGSFLACNFDGICNKHCRACTPMPHFTPDGYVSACDLVTFGANAHHMDCFVYGKWNEYDRVFEFDYAKILALQNRSTDNMIHCRDCLAREQCGGYCLGEVTNETGSMYGQKATSCSAILRLFKELGASDIVFPFPHP